VPICKMRFIANASYHFFCNFLKKLPRKLLRNIKILKFLHVVAFVIVGGMGV
jgi:hypothetical protein